MLPTLKEQEKIESLLGALEEKIDILGNQVELYRKWKRGLLQGMFI